MKLPYLTDDGSRTEKYIVNFRGLHYGEGSVDGQLSDCKNLSTEKFPCITPRRERVEVGAYSAPASLHAKDGLMVIDGTKVLYKGKEVGTVTAGKKQTATIGNYVCIFPDKVYYDVVEDTFQSMEKGWRKEWNITSI